MFLVLVEATSATMIGMAIDVILVYVKYITLTNSFFATFQLQMIAWYDYFFKKDARQPLLSDDDGSPSESSFSEEDAGANTSGYTRRKAKNNNTTTRDTKSELIYTSDNRNYTCQEEQDIPGEAVSLTKLAQLSCRWL